MYKLKEGGNTIQIRDVYYMYAQNVSPSPKTETIPDPKKYSQQKIMHSFIQI